MKFIFSFNDYAREPVPTEKSSNWLQIGTILIGVAIAVPAFLIGSTLGGALGLQNTLIAVYSGAFIVAVMAALTGIVGARTKVSTYIITQKTFGTIGAKIVAGVIALSLFGWFGVNTGVFATSAQKLFSGIGIEVTQQVWALLGGILMMSTAIIGFRALEKLSILAVPLLTVLLVVALYNALSDVSFATLFFQEISEGSMSLGSAISLIAGAFMVGAIVVPDLTRYARSSGHAVGATSLGLLIGFPTILFATAILAAVTQAADLVTIFNALGLGSFALITLVFAAWTTNDNNLYSASLGLATIFKNIEKWKLAAAAGIIGTLFAVFGILDFFVPWLSFLGILIPPIGGIYVVNHFFVDVEGKAKKIYWKAFVAWIVASLFAYLTTDSISGGIGLFTFTTIPAVDSILISAVLYFLFEKFSK